MSEKPPCAMAKCHRPVVARGWCDTHYKANHHQGPCDAGDCERPAKVTGLCYAHYGRKRRLGDPLADRPLKARNKNGQGGLRNGYRVHTVNGQTVYEHRSVMEQMLGRPMLPFENVHHRNGLRHDNRPENLELWTKKQPYGQRVSDLVDFVAEFYEEEVLKAIEARRTEA